MIVSIASLINIGNKIKQFYEHPFQVSASANIINSRFEQMQKSVFRSISTTEEKITQEALENAKLANEIISDNMTIVSELILGDRSVVDELQAHLDTLAPMRAKVVELAGANKNNEAAAYMEENNIPVIKKAQKTLDALIEQASNTGSTLIQELQQAQTITIIMLVILSLGAITISLLFAKIITNSITRPVNELQTVTENLAAGKLDADSITYQSQDELGRLVENMKSSMTTLRTMIQDVDFLTSEIAKGNFSVKTRAEKYYVGEFEPLLIALRDMNTNLSDTLSQIDEASSQVSSGSLQMAESAQSLAEGATEQAGAVEELNATIENVADTAKTTADDTKSAANEVDISVKKANSSRQKMKELTMAMERIDATSKEIGNIISEIEDIASQTNLLSVKRIFGIRFATSS